MGRFRRIVNESRHLRVTREDAVGNQMRGIIANFASERGWKLRKSVIFHVSLLILSLLCLKWTLNIPFPLAGICFILLWLLVVGLVLSLTHNIKCERSILEEFCQLIHELGQGALSVDYMNRWLQGIDAKLLLSIDTSVDTLIEDQAASERLAKPLIDNIRLLPQREVWPPSTAENLLCLVLPQSEREEVIGSMTKCFHRDVKRYGEKKARHYFWTQTIRELWPFLKRTLRFLFLGWFGSIIRRFLF